MMTALLASIPPLQKLVVAMTTIVVLLLLLVFVRTINASNNTLEWWHLISAKAADGSQWASWDQIGRGLGVVLCFWLPAVYAYSPKMDAGGLAMVMGVALAYLGGVSAYAATLKARQGTVETSRVTEPASAQRVIENKIETPPIT
jgi:hypothetical protein